MYNEVLFWVLGGQFHPPHASKRIARGDQTYKRNVKPFAGYIQKKGRWQLCSPSCRARPPGLIAPGRGLRTSARGHLGCTRARRPALSTTKSRWIAFSVLCKSFLPLRQRGWTTVSQSSPVRAVLGTVRVCSQRQADDAFLQLAGIFFN